MLQQLVISLFITLLIIETDLVALRLYPGLHILPNSLSMSTGSVFAGWVMHKTGRYKTINLIFGVFPFIGASAIYFIKEDSGWFQSWFSIVSFSNLMFLYHLTI